MIAILFNSCNIDCCILLIVLANLISCNAKFLPSPFASSKPKNGLGTLSAVNNFFCKYCISAISDKLVAPGSVSIGLGALGSLTGIK